MILREFTQQATGTVFDCILYLEQECDLGGVSVALLRASQRHQHEAVVAVVLPHARIVVHFQAPLATPDLKPTAEASAQCSVLLGIFGQWCFFVQNRGTALGIVLQQPNPCQVCFLSCFY